MLPFDTHPLEQLTVLYVPATKLIVSTMTFGSFTILRKNSKDVYFIHGCMTVFFLRIQPILSPTMLFLLIYSSLNLFRPTCCFQTDIFQPRQDTAQKIRKQTGLRLWLCGYFPTLEFRIKDGLIKQNLISISIYTFKKILKFLVLTLFLSLPKNNCN